MIWFIFFSEIWYPPALQRGNIFKKTKKICDCLLFYFVQEEKSVICVLLRRASESFKNTAASFMFVFL